MTQEERNQEARCRAEAHFLTLTPEQQEDVLTFRRALERNLLGLLSRTSSTPSGKGGRVLFAIAPPAPGEECTIPELRKAGLIR